MTEPAEHRCRVIGSPWAGVHATSIQSSRSYGKHWHETHGLGLLEHGAQRSASGRGQVDAHAGDLITTNPGEVHDGRPLGHASRRWRMLYLDPGVIASMAGAPGRVAEIELARPVLQDRALGAALVRLFAHLDGWAGDPASTDVDALACEESLVRTCALLVARHAASGPAPACIAAADPAVLRVRDRLGDTLLDPPTLAEMALTAGMSKYQLLRRFERRFGLPPHAWLMQQRAERARALICSGSGLAQAAASCGFADQSHMTRVFARQFGFTPGAWRRAVARTSLQ